MEVDSAELDVVVQRVPVDDIRLRPLRRRTLTNSQTLMVDEAGRHFAADNGFAERVSEDRPTARDFQFLKSEGHVLGRDGSLAELSHLWTLAQRRCEPQQLDYLILVPTLRCNLTCSYCQVSRVNVDRLDYDWEERTLAAVLEIIDRIDSDSIKIEFQGGEPTLRPDLIKAVIDQCGRFRQRSFVVCTNLARLDDEILQLFDNPDLSISTSLDGQSDTHLSQRTGSDAEQGRFLTNLDLVLQRYGPDKVSALPTVDPVSPPSPDALIEAYASRALHSIFLRPINYQGFARKRHPASRDPGEAWRAYHEQFVRRIIERNWIDQSRVIEETYLSLCLRRIFQPGHDRHVDLRNPNPIGVDYVVIDHDGTVYPTDEARMLARSGVIDLAIGDVWTGWDTDARRDLHEASHNTHDVTCRACAYQPFCGRDLVDDIARYGRIDMPRGETEFCRRHIHLFDLAFSLIYSDDPATRYSLARWLRLPGEMPSPVRYA